MKLNCCDRPGQYCQTYRRSDLYGRIWELAHGINCDLEQHERIKAGLLAKSPTIAPNASGDEVEEKVLPESETLPIETLGLRKTASRKPCGCKKKSSSSQR